MVVVAYERWFLTRGPGMVVTYKKCRNKEV